MPSAIIIGNSDGIGLAVTELLLGEGWRVVGISRRASNVESANYEHHVADVCAPDYADRLTAIVATTPFHVGIYCAGIGTFVDLSTLLGERAVFETNLLGAVTTAEVVLPAMLRAGGGHFLGLSSQSDQIVNAAAPSYSASKAGLSSYLEGLAVAYRPKGVFVTNVRFGFVDTKMAKSSVRPFMMSPSAAASKVRGCLDRRPIRATFPKRLGWLLWFVRLGAALKRPFL